MHNLASIEVDKALSLEPFRTTMQASCLYRRIVEDPEHVNAFDENIANKYTSPDGLLESLHDPENELLEWYVMQHSNGIVGSAVIRPMNVSLGHYDIGYWVGGAHTQRGYAKKSARALVDNLVNRDSVRLITGVVHEENIHSRAVLRYAGLTEFHPIGNRKLAYQLATRNVTKAD